MKVLNRQVGFPLFPYFGECVFARAVLKNCSSKSHDGTGEQTRQQYFLVGCIVFCFLILDLEKQVWMASRGDGV